MPASVRAHRVAFLIECRGATHNACARLTSITFGEIAPYSAALNWLDLARLDRDNPRSLRAGLIWEQAELPVSEDLHRSVRTILSARPGKDQTETPIVFQLGERGRNLLAGRYRAAPMEAGSRRGAAGLVLTLGHAAARRLQLAPPARLGLRIAQVRFIPFRTDFAILLVEITLHREDHEPLTPEMLVEAVNLCADERRDPPLSWTDSQERLAFHPTDILRPLFAAADIALTGPRRLYTYTTALIEGDLTASVHQEIGLRLSRHYNYSYMPEATGTELYRPFAPVVHAMSIEGAASIVHLSPIPTEDTAAGPGAPPEYLSSWIENAYSRTYLPVALIVLHEYSALLDLAQSVALEVDFRHFSEGQAQQLRQICDRFLALRLRYRPALVSNITMHNNFYDLFRQVLGLPALERKASQDAVEAELRLSRFAAERERRATEALHRRWAWHGALVAGALTFLVIMDMAKQIRELMNGFTQQEEIPQLVVGIGGLVLALLLGAFGAISGWARLRHGTVESPETREAEDMHLAHTASE
jgi:hypothetical protein